MDIDGKKWYIGVRIDKETYEKLLELCRKMNSKISETVRVSIKTTYDLLKDVDNVSNKQIVIQNPVVNIHMGEKKEEKEEKTDSSECWEYREATVRLLALIMCYERQKCSPIRFVNKIAGEIASYKNLAKLKEEAIKYLENAI